MNRPHPLLRKFLDIEADVDEEDSESDEDGDQYMQETFIDDITDDGPDPRDVHHEIPDLVAGAERVDTFYENMLARACGTSHQLRYNVESLSADEFQRAAAQQMESIACSPGPEDKPIWRVKCRIGLEEILVAFLFTSARDEHGLRSAFTRGSIRGYVYLECDMNLTLIRLLEKSPGVIRTRAGIIRNQVDTLDCTNLLRMKVIHTIKDGEWVRVNSGAYKGDVGLVSTVQPWGVDLLLVPRLEYQPADKKGKRKASRTRHPPKLFDAEKFEETSSATCIHNPDGTYTLGTLRIEHGLTLKTFDYHSVSPRVSNIAWGHLSMFVSSGHPSVDVSVLPRPQEWIFFEQEKVVVRSSKKRGSVEAIAETYAEVDIGDEGMHRISWWDLEKDVSIGDFVSVKGGQHRGYEGWIIGLEDVLAKVIDKLEVNATNPDANVIDVHINCLVLTDVPLQIAPSLAQTKEQYDPKIRHPWCGTKVIVMKQHHPRRGDLFQVVGVLHNQATSSGIRLELQCQHFSPYTPFQKRITVDYSDVVEHLSSLELNFFFDPSRNAKEKHIQLPDTEHAIFDAGGSTTPIRNESIMFTPAWNPSAKTPMSHSVMDATSGGDEYSHLTAAWDPSSLSPMSQASRKAISDCGPSSDTPAAKSPCNTDNDQHILLDELLANVKLNVIVDGGGCKKKELVASVTSLEGRLAICYVKYGRTHILQPEWVTPKHPNAAYDNGLLVVIKGEHCGKFVRRLHHRHTDSISIMTLAVINRIEGGEQTLQEETLELGTDFLCSVSESKDEKDRNKSLTQALRDAYRKKTRS